MKNLLLKIQVFIVSLLFSTFVSSLGYADQGVLDWKKISWSSVDFFRIPIEGGAALYTIPGKTEKNFKIYFVFPYSLFHVPNDLKPTFSAFSSMILFGGTKGKTFDELSHYLSQSGISISTEDNFVGQFMISVSALSTDFDKAVDVLGDILFYPMYSAEALDIWKQEQRDEFVDLLTAGDYRKQSRFMFYLLNKMGFGLEHHFTETISRESPKAINAITNDNIKKIGAQVINRSGFNAVLSGGFTNAQVNRLVNLVKKIPKKEISAYSSLPERPLPSEENRLRFAVIEKPDMKQSAIEMRILLPNIGELNEQEKTELKIAAEVLSATAGVVGSDRWSRAMRVESGLSYSPHAYFDDHMLNPNTNTGYWRLGFQSPNDKIEEACVLARKTWMNFITNGINEAEFSAAKTTLMNKIMASEKTIFDKTDAFLYDLGHGRLPDSTPEETELALLDKISAVGSVNKTLAKYIKPNISLMAIIGSPSIEGIEKLKNNKDFELKEKVLFSDLIKVFQ